MMDAIVSVGNNVFGANFILLSAYTTGVEKNLKLLRDSEEREYWIGFSESPPEGFVIGEGR